MRIATHPFHRAIEYYWLRLFPEHEFQFVASSELPSAPEGMPLRPHPKNFHLVTTAKNCDLAVAHTFAAYEYFKDKFPTIMWFHHLPYTNADPPHVNVAVYLTPEAQALWNCGARKVVCRHPIEVEKFPAHIGGGGRYLNVATMPIDWWGEKKGAGLFKYLLERNVKIKLVGMNNEADYPECEPEFVTSEARMYMLYQFMEAYICTSPQTERSPLEALATGMPVIAMRHKFNTLLEETSDLIYWADTPEGYFDLCRNFRKQDIYKLKDRIWKIFRPEEVRKSWKLAFSLI